MGGAERSGGDQQSWGSYLTNIINSNVCAYTYMFVTTLQNGRKDRDKIWNRGGLQSGITRDRGRNTGKS